MGERVAQLTGAEQALFGRLPEFDLELANGLHVVSLMAARGNPRWVVFDNRAERRRWLCIGRGMLRVDAH